MKYHSSKFNWFKNNNALPNTTNVVRYLTFVTLVFSSLKVEDSDKYKCNSTDDKNIQGKRFQLIVFVKWFYFR